jgi:sugar lactone lactonase YvrE
LIRQSSDIPNNRIMRYDETTGAFGVFRQPANFSNGLTRDRQGRLLACEHLTRRVTRTEYDGRITVLADSFNGKKLNSPNDIICKSDGSIWFTDPRPRASAASMPRVFGSPIACRITIKALAVISETGADMSRFPTVAHFASWLG